MQRTNLIPQRLILRALATKSWLGNLFSAAKSINSACFVASRKGRINEPKYLSLSL